MLSPSNPFIELRMQMIRFGISVGDIAKVIGRSHSYMGYRFSGSAPFDLNEVYKICDLLEIPYESITTYFPPLKSLRKAGGAALRRRNSWKCLQHSHHLGKYIIWRKGFEEWAAEHSVKETPI